MHRDHQLFMQGVGNGRKIKLTFSSEENEQELVKVCAPIFYSANLEKGGLAGRYHFWDIGNWTGDYPFNLPAGKIVSMELTEEIFDSSEFATWKSD